jgi:hypothetical protein
MIYRGGPAVPYQAEISRVNPSCFLFLIDQSGSMSDRSASGETGNSKAEDTALAINNVLRNLIITCSKSEGVRDYFHVGVIGYGQNIGPAFAGPLAGQKMVPVSAVADNPARLEERVKKVNDGAGGLVDQTIRFPIWFDPQAGGVTPMCQAFTLARETLAEWIAAHPDSFPPLVMNITDGESTDGDPSFAMRFVTELATSDGNAFLFNVHVSSHAGAKPTVFPDSPAGLPDAYSQMLFNNASELTPHMRSVAREYGIATTEGSRAFILNADPTLVIAALEIGTRPSNLER